MTCAYGAEKYVPMVYTMSMVQYEVKKDYGVYGVNGAHALESTYGVCDVNGVYEV